MKPITPVKTPRQVQHATARQLAHANRYPPAQHEGTLTAHLRSTNPSRYRRKDARTAVLRMVYGPSNDRHTQKLSLATWKAHQEVIERHLPNTGWPAVRIIEVLNDFDALMPKQKQEQKEAA